MLNIDACELIARTMQSDPECRENKAFAILRTPGTGAIYRFQSCLKLMGLESRLIDLSHYNPDIKDMGLADLTYAKKLFMELYNNQGYISILYLNPKFTSGLGGATNAVLKAMSLTVTNDRRVYWNSPDKKLAMISDTPIVFIIDKVEDLSPDLLKLCRVVDISR